MQSTDYFLISLAFCVAAVLALVFGAWLSGMSKIDVGYVGSERVTLSATITQWIVLAPALLSFMLGVGFLVAGIFAHVRRL